VPRGFQTGCRWGLALLLAVAVVFAQTGTPPTEKKEPKNKSGKKVLSAQSEARATPHVNRFEVQPSAIAPGETAILSWEVTGVDQVEITHIPGKQAPTGTVEVHPTDTTEYVLKVAGVLEKRTLNVYPKAPNGGTPPPAPLTTHQEFSLSPASPSLGGSDVLWIGCWVAALILLALQLLEWRKAGRPEVTLDFADGVQNRGVQEPEAALSEVFAAERAADLRKLGSPLGKQIAAIDSIISRASQATQPRPETALPPYDSRRAEEPRRIPPPKREPFSQPPPAYSPPPPYPPPLPEPAQKTSSWNPPVISEPMPAGTLFRPPAAPAYPSAFGQLLEEYRRVKASGDAAEEERFRTSHEGQRASCRNAEDRRFDPNATLYFQASTRGWFLLVEQGGNILGLPWFSLDLVSARDTFQVAFSYPERSGPLGVRQPARFTKSGDEWTLTEPGALGSDG